VPPPYPGWHELVLVAAFRLELNAAALEDLCVELASRARPRVR